MSKKAAIVSISVRLYLSTNPSDFGLYAVVLVLVTPKILQTSVKTSDTKLRPWSEWIYLGTPKRHVNSADKFFCDRLSLLVGNWVGLHPFREVVTNYEDILVAIIRHRQWTKDVQGNPLHGRPTYSLLQRSPSCSAMNLAPSTDVTFSQGGTESHFSYQPEKYLCLALPMDFFQSKMAPLSR